MTMGWLSRILARTDAAAEAPAGDPIRIAEVEAVLADLRPMLRLDGGDVELIAVEPDGLVRVRFRGACTHCMAQSTTVEAGLQPRLEAELLWFGGLELV